MPGPAPALIWGSGPGCWKKQTMGKIPIMCCNVKHYFNRAARAPDYNVVFEAPVKKATKRCQSDIAVEKLRSVAPKLYCSSCDTMIDPRDPLSKDHLKYQCMSIPSTPLKPGFSKDKLARRMAALGSKKKLYKHNFTPH